MKFARQYHRRQCEWLPVVDIVGVYSAKTEEKLIEWPSEFPTESPRIDDALRLRWCAPDQRMYTARERRSNCFYNMNGFVENPRQTHAESRERLCRTEEERTVFLDRSGFSSITVLITGNFSLYRGRLASVHLQGLFSRCEILRSNAPLFLDYNTLPVSALELRQDIFS
jgi:hypothetical protein